MKITKIKTSRGKEGIEVRNYKYRKDKTLVTGEISWRCLSRTCSASLKTNHAVTVVKSSPPQHNHDPPSLLSSPLTSTPTSQSSSTYTPPASLTDSSEIISECHIQSLTELLSPYTTLIPEPPKFAKLEEENTYLRQRIAELMYTNKALTDKLISLETEIIRINDTKTDFNQPTITTESNNLIVYKNAPELPVNIKKSQVISVSTQTNTSVVKMLEGIQVIEADMGDIIDELKFNSSTAFAHTISGDFNNERQMTAGVAVVFKKRFGKPQASDCVTKSLVLQKTIEGAAVYSLVTKPYYNSKPTVEEYNIAFDDFIGDFKKNEFKTLVCSPMGCVRDLIELDHFVAKIKQFHETTGANIIIVSKDQRARRVIRHGLPHSEFVKQLRAKIKKNTDSWYKLPDEDLTLHLLKVQIPENTLVLQPSISHLLKNSKITSEVNTLLSDLQVDTYDYILAPVNDNNDDSREGGTHWSLLMYTRQTDTYYHLDSLEPLNTTHARRLAARISGDPDVDVVRLRCRRQEKSVECGAYVLHYIQLICYRIQNNLPIQDDRCFVQQFSVNKIYDEITNYKQLNQIQENKVKAKITLLADSHGRGLRHLIQGGLGQHCDVLSVIKPNATLECVTSGLDCEISKLKSSDHLIVLGGTNNINVNTEYDVKPFVREIANKTINTNVVLCTVPLRYDTPHLNNKIRKINIDLVMESLKYEHIKLISLSHFSSKHYTFGGLHLNRWGKQKLGRLLVDKINSPNLN